jgi:hypothetical protein
MIPRANGLWDMGRGVGGALFDFGTRRPSRFSPSCAYRVFGGCVIFLHHDEYKQNRG